MAYQNKWVQSARENVAPYGKAGVALSVGDLIYLDSAGVYQKAAASAAGTALASQTRALYVVIQDALIYEAVAAARITLIDGFTGLVIGAPVYLSTTGTMTQTSPGIGYIQQIIGYAISATEVLVNIEKTGDCSKGIEIAAGTHTTAGGDAIETITVSGCISTDLAFVQTCSLGATPRSVSASNTTTSAGFITVTMSGDPSTDHKLAYHVIRPKS